MSPRKAYIRRHLTILVRKVYRIVDGAQSVRHISVISGCAILLNRGEPLKTELLPRWLDKKRATHDSEGATKPTSKSICTRVNTIKGISDIGPHYQIRYRNVLHLQLLFYCILAG